MMRRDFLKVSGIGLLALPLIKFDSLETNVSEGLAQRETSLWIHGSPYLGHSDYRKDFRGLSPEEIKQEIAHFRTAEPWRRMILFKL
jgi:hypothetical protein